LLPIAALCAVDPSGLAPFGPAKWALVPTLVLLGFAALAHEGRLRLDGARALAAFVAWTAVCAAFGLDGLYAWTGTPERHFGVITWALVLLCWWAGRSLDAHARRIVLIACTIAIGAAGGWAGAEVLGWEPLRLVGVGDRPVGPLGSSAFLAAAAVLLTPIALGQTMQSRGWARVAAAATAGLGLTALAASGARAAILASVVVAVIVVVMHRDRRVLAVVGACALVGVGVVVASGAAHRVSSLASDRDGGARGRLDEWRVAARVVADRPVIGTGPEGYRIAFGRAVDDRYEQSHGRAPVPDRAHSALLDVAATTGLPGLGLYLVAVAMALVAAWKTVRRGPPLLAGAAVGVVAYFAQSVFLFPIAELEPLAWLLAGICAAERVPATKRERRVVATTGVGLAVVVAVAGLGDVMADRRAKHELARVAQDEPAMANVATLRPDQVRYRLVDARIHEKTATRRGLRRAIADLDHALAVSPRDPVVRTEKGRLLLELAQLGGEKANARAHLEQLSRDDPRNAETLLRLGVARDLTGDTTAAIAAWRGAERLAPHSAAASANLAVAYARQGRRAAAAAAARRALARDPHNDVARAVLEQLAKDGT
jgi:O-antigen ligase/Flp pilus assembly protein TadD